MSNSLSVSHAIDTLVDAKKMKYHQECHDLAQDGTVRSKK